MPIRPHRKSEYAERFPGLEAFCEYLGMEWDYEYGTPQGAVYAFCHDRVGEPDALTAAAGIQVLLDAMPDDKAVFAQLDPMGFNYWPPKGSLRAFLVWARQTILDAIDGAVVPPVPTPVPMELQSPEMLLLRFPHLRRVGKKFFTDGGDFPTAYEAYEAYVEQADANEEALTFAALNMLDSYAQPEADARRLLTDIGWRQLPPSGQLSDFIRYAVALSAARANQRWREERGLGPG